MRKSAFKVAWRW